MEDTARARSGGVPPFEVARAVIAALADGRVADVLALTDPRVVCWPVTRPGRSMYEGHAGMAQLVVDLHAVWGRYQVEVEDAGAGAGEAGDGGDRVLVRLRMTHQTGQGEVTEPPVLAEFIVRGGLVTRIEGRDED